MRRLPAHDTLIPMTRFPKGLPREFDELKQLDTPVKIQDFIDSLAINHEPRGKTYRSPLWVLRRRDAHCMEGALLAAAALWMHGQRPLLLDLKTTKDDSDHVVALFRKDGKWGAISKSNHAVLRYRDPVYASVRELAMSFFHEYHLDSGKKTLRSFSKPFDLSRRGAGWLTAREHNHDLAWELDISPHTPILGRSSGKLRLADDIQIRAGKLLQYDKKKK